MPRAMRPAPTELRRWCYNLQGSWDLALTTKAKAFLRVDAWILGCERCHAAVRRSVSGKRRATTGYAHKGSGNRGRFGSRGLGPYAASRGAGVRVAKCAGPGNRLGYLTRGTLRDPRYSEEGSSPAKVGLRPGLRPAQVQLSRVKNPIRPNCADASSLAGKHAGPAFAGGSSDDSHVSACRLVVRARVVRCPRC